MASESARRAALMRRALRLAARGRTSPNPQVGAIVARRDGTVLGEGFHARCGEAHAEPVALAAAGRRARRADLYVTLEPCNHHGRTPPCTEAILAAGVSRVFVGSLDPDPRVSGAGAARLRAAGVEVVVGLEAERCALHYEAYRVHRTLGRPHVTMKAGMTLDGRLATRTGHSRWVTGEASRAASHRLRDRLDAILVGVGTVVADDPELTTRLPGRRGHDPIRVVVDSRLRTPEAARVVRHASSSPTILAFAGPEPASAGALERPGVELLRCRSRGGRVDLSDLLRRLAARGIVTLLAEGGGAIHGSLLEGGLVDRVMLFMAPVIVGGTGSVPVVGGRGVARMPDAFRVEGLQVRRLGGDLLLTGRIPRASS